MTRRAFTLIEMVIVCVVLVLMAAIVIPNMIGMMRSRALFAEEQAVLRVPRDVRSQAVHDKLPVLLRVDGNVLVVDRHKDEGDDEEITRIRLDALQIRSARLNGKSVDMSSWKWTVYPDGTSDTGGLEFAEGATQKSLALSANADARWVQGTLPDTSDDTWQAGQLQTRN
jgi:prepilin-type N-terminal cleavage/methylation domain-containing protein